MTPDAKESSQETPKPQGAIGAEEQSHPRELTEEEKMRTLESLVPTAFMTIEASAEDLGYTDRGLGALLIRAHIVPFLRTLKHGTHLEAMQVTLSSMASSLMRMEQIRFMVKLVVSQLCGEGIVLHESAKGGDPIVTKIMQDIRSQLFDEPSMDMNGELPKREVSRTDVYMLAEQAYKKLVQGKKTSSSLSMTQTRRK